MDLDFSVEMGDFVKKSGKKSYFIWNLTGSGGSIDCDPVIHNGRIYIGATDFYFYCLDLSGKEIWRFRASGPFEDSMARFRGDSLFIGCNDGFLYCLDKHTGKKLWAFRTGGNVMTSPTVHENMVLFTSRDGFVYCLSTEGKELWRFRTGGFAMSTPTIHNDKIFVGSSDGRLYCLSMEGKELWRFQTESNVYGKNDFCIRDDVIYFTTNEGTLYAVDLNKRKELWRFRMSGGITASPKIHGNRIYQTSHDGNLYCLSLEGKELWRFRAERMIGGSLLIDDKIYMGIEGGNFYCLSLEGKELWRYRTNGDIWSAPVAHQGKIMFGCWDCRLYCLDSESGRVIWSFETSSKVQTPFEYEKVERHEYNEPKRRGVEEKVVERYTGPKNPDEKEYTKKSEYSSKSEYASREKYGD